MCARPSSIPKSFPRGEVGGRLPFRPFSSHVNVTGFWAQARPTGEKRQNCESERGEESRKLIMGARCSTLPTNTSTRIRFRSRSGAEKGRYGVVNWHSISELRKGNGTLF